MYQLRLATIAGLDINNAQHSVAIDEALYGITDPEAFLEYCRDKKDDIQYATKPERLDTLATRYKKLQSKAALPYDTANSFADILAGKMEQSRMFLKNELETGTHNPHEKLKLDGKPFFGEKELNALNSLGSIAYVIEITETGEIKRKLVDLFIEKYIPKKKYEALTDNQKKVHELTAGVAK